jgi:diguanylate cyclase (GGDEF)-like protein
MPKKQPMLFSVFRRLMGPVSALPDPEGRQARLLAWMLLSLLIILFAVILIVYLANPPGSPRRVEYVPMMAGLMLVLALAFFLNRRGKYTTAARIAVICSVVGPWVSVWLDRTILDGDYMPLTYTALPIMLCGILLSARETAALGGLQIVLLGLLRAANPSTAAFNWPSLVTFVMVMSVLSVVANTVNRRNQEQINRQTRRLAENEKLLRERSVRDHLTGLFNRRFLEETLERELRGAESGHNQVGLIMFDIDHLKQFNDTYGHAAGDRLLREVGDFLQAHFRAGDVICRYGGDEFTLVLNNTSLETTRARAERLREEVKSLSVEFEGQILERFTLSCGVAVFPVHGSSAESVLRAGDDALYRAKREGRDRVVVAEPAVSESGNP